MMENPPELGGRNKPVTGTGDEPVLQGGDSQVIGGWREAYLAAMQTGEYQRAIYGFYRAMCPEQQWLFNQFSGRVADRCLARYGNDFLEYPLSMVPKRTLFKALCRGAYTLLLCGEQHATTKQSS